VPAHFTAPELIAFAFYHREAEDFPRAGEPVHRRCARGPSSGRSPFDARVRRALKTFDLDTCIIVKYSTI
jgi:hypothetical protein